MEALTCPRHDHTFFNLRLKEMDDMYLSCIYLLMIELLSIFLNKKKKKHMKSLPKIQENKCQLSQLCITQTQRYAKLIQSL